MFNEKISCKRLVIYPKDVELMTGKGARAAQKMIADVRKWLGKEKHQLIMISEFCEYSGLDEKMVRSMIF